MVYAGSSSSSPPQPGNVAQSQLPASNTTISSSSNAAAAPQQQPQQQPRKAVVVGGGWAGFGAALALAKAGAEVTLLDASENPGGLSSARTTAGGHVVEPGIKGFWYQVGVFRVEGFQGERACGGLTRPKLGWLVVHKQAVQPSLFQHVQHNTPT
jgi:hypothetical protein